MGLTGVMVIVVRAGGVTVIVVVPVLPPKVAEMVAEPTLTAVASPLEPIVLLIVTLASFEAHVTDVVMSCVVLSENVPVAVNCWVPPRAIEGLAGVTEIETIVADVTVSRVEPVLPL
jgi:hypothetical protein